MCGYYETKMEKLLLSQIVHSLLTHQNGKCGII